MNVVRALFFNLIAHPSSLESLRQELKHVAEEGGNLGLKEVRGLPYLDACIKEAARIHPSIGLPLERVVPQSGVVLCGEMLPAGTIVGINAWVINRDKKIFGSDADCWRPERWLGDKRERAKMEQTLFTVGLDATYTYDAMEV